MPPTRQSLLVLAADANIAPELSTSPVRIVYGMHVMHCYV